MKAKAVFIFAVILALQVANSAPSIPTAQCIFQVYTPSSNSIGTTSVLVSGDTQGSDFNSNTRVVVKCNSDNASPGAVQQEVNARIAAFSQSTLPFSTSCEYKQSAFDSTYKIAAVLLPHGVECISQGQNTVVIKALQTGQEQSSQCGGLGQAPCLNVTCENPQFTFCKTYTCKAPLISNGEVPVEKARCVNSSSHLQNSTPSNSVVAGNSTLQQGFGTSELTPSAMSPGSYAVSKLQGGNVQLMFDSSWSLIGLPASGFTYDGCAYDSTNKVKIYYYDALTQSFIRTAVLSPSPYLTGRGYAVKTDKPCSIEVKQPKWLTFQTLNLQKGWNLISVQTNPNVFSNIFDSFTVKSNCEVTSGPWMYNSKYKKYYKQRGFTPGIAYWIKVASPCTISNAAEDSAPPELPTS